MKVLSASRKQRPCSARDALKGRPRFPIVPAGYATGGRGMFRIDPSCSLSTATIEGHPAVVMTWSLPCPYALCYSKAGWWWWCGVARHENRNYRLIRPRGISTPAKKNTQILSYGRHNKFIIVPSLADVDKRNLARTLVRMTSLQCWKQQQQI